MEPSSIALDALANGSLSAQFGRSGGPRMMTGNRHEPSFEPRSWVWDQDLWTFVAFRTCSITANWIGCGTITREGKMKRGSFAICAAVVFSVSLSSSFAQTDPLIGVWKLNLEKSTVTGPPPRSSIVVFVAIVGGLRAELEGIDA